MGRNDFFIHFFGIGKKKSGEVNSQWSGKPATMIRKVAVAQILKEAFPDENAGLYVPEEIPEATEIQLDEVAVTVEESTPHIEEKTNTKGETANVADVLFAEDK